LKELFLLNVLKDPKSVNKSKTSEAMAAILFACTKNYKFLHSAHKISDAIIKAVALQVAGIG